LGSKDLFVEHQYGHLKYPYLMTGLFTPLSSSSVVMQENVTAKNLTYITALLTINKTLVCYRNGSVRNAGSNIKCSLGLRHFDHIS
jgi:hypothetical protein